MDAKLIDLATAPRADKEGSRLRVLPPHPASSRQTSSIHPSIRLSVPAPGSLGRGREGAGAHPLGRAAEEDG